MSSIVSPVTLSGVRQSVVDDINNRILFIREDDWYPMLMYKNFKDSLASSCRKRSLHCSELPNGINISCK
jgi:hypothetical protein